MNKELARRVANYIVTNPETFNQSVWIRQDDPDLPDAACVAGRVALMTGWAKDPDVPRFGSEVILVKKDGQSTRAVSDVAREALELSEDDARWLFSEYQTTDQILKFLYDGDVPEELKAWLDPEE